MISLQFMGAAGTVTGSKYALTVGDSKLLIDCGLFQGEKELRARNWEPFPRPPQEFQKMLLTHAHVDHSGYIPCLYRQGFRGKILTTRASQQLCEILLPDSARLQEEEAAYLARHGLSRHILPNPSTLSKMLRIACGSSSPSNWGRKSKCFPVSQPPFMRPATSWARPGSSWNWPAMGGVNP